jgi:PAS domain S-box-containing protein
MALVGLDYRLLKVNKAFCRMLGYTEAELTGRSFVGITHPEDVEKDTHLAKEVFAGQIPSYRLEKRYIKKSGDVLEAHLTATVIRTADGRALYGLGMIEDVTARREAELAGRRAATLAAVTQLANAAAHEINNPLAVLAGQLELLARELPREGRERRRIEAVLAAADQIHEIVARMGRITRLEPFELPADLPRALDIRKSSPQAGPDVGSLQGRRRPAARRVARGPRDRDRPS